MNKGINLSLFDMFDLDNDETNIIRENVEKAGDLLKLNNNDKEITINNENEKICIGTKVYIEYNSVTYIGEVYSIYNDGNTVNVIFENKHSAFHISQVKKL
ncbi:hypothetical protein HYH38_16035 [Clostridium botulinum]|uniref:Uncharacterized protein n=1 Tax=Clostridium botulinum TaxID=1491 RepID=A0A0M1LC61_CLOBO|nr:hypothetical protein [Clostridium botulinum]ALT05463.1 hypothetical protein [Clostridium botulinum]ALT05561.1 hypothetical protein [Clostridium botulinum]KOR55289.1 hypothetical protein ADT22_16890 [Clostridium botulinum]MBN1040224.1 hypothetical protein [Clostridium botulinum]MBY6810973.1 hypothetical protein [Clostridium botulinum]